MRRISPFNCGTRSKTPERHTWQEIKQLGLRDSRFEELDRQLANQERYAEQKAQKKGGGR